MNNTDPQETLDALQALGITLPSPTYIVGAIAFGLVGLVAFRRGRRTQHHRTTGLGLALMFFPYLVAETRLMFLVGTALCVALWFDRP